MRKLKRYIIFLMTILIVMVGFSNLIINQHSKKYLYNNLFSMHTNEYGIVFGTNKYLSGGGINTYFKGRIIAASKLFKAHKIKKIIVSGYIASLYYNEPKQIKKELLILGVPDSVIHLDTSGYRTLNSIINLRNISTHDTITIISQKFHNQRAVYLAHKNGIKAVGYNVPDSTSWDNLKTQFREIFAKTLAFGETLFNFSK
jgi:SanA protein